MWDTVSATFVYLNLIHSSGWGFPAVRNGSLCAKSTEWHRRAVHFTKGSGVLWPSRPAEGRDKLALRWRQHSGTEPMSTSTQQAQDPEWSGITGLERGFLFSFLFFFTAKKAQTLSIISSGTCEGSPPMGFNKSEKRKEKQRFEVRHSPFTSDHKTALTINLFKNVIIKSHGSLCSLVPVVKKNSLQHASS